jgi:hypothetical protein
LDPAWAFKRQCLIIRRPSAQGGSAVIKEPKKNRTRRPPTTSAALYIKYQQSPPVAPGVFPAQLTASSEERMKRSNGTPCPSTRCPVPAFHKALRPHLAKPIQRSNRTNKKQSLVLCMEAMAYAHAPSRAPHCAARSGGPLDNPIRYRCATNEGHFAESLRHVPRPEKATQNELYKARLNASSRPFKKVSIRHNCRTFD